MKFLLYNNEIQLNIEYKRGINYTCIKLERKLFDKYYNIKEIIF